MDNPTIRVQRAVSDLSAGRPIVVAGATPGADAHLVIAAEKATVENVAFLIRHGSGLVCAAMTGRDCDRLGLTAMVGIDRNHPGTEYTVSVDAIGTGTGISATDRALTLRSLADDTSTPDRFTRPGHVLGARTADAGVFSTYEIAEASVDLVGIAGTGRVGAFSALVSEVDPTTMAGSDEAEVFASEQGLSYVCIHDLVTYRRMNELHLSTEFEVVRQTPHGTVKCIGYRSDVTGIEYVAYTMATSPDYMPLISLIMDNDPAPHIAHDDRVAEAVSIVAANGGGTVIVARSRTDVCSSVGFHTDTVEIVRELGYQTVDLLNFPDTARTMMWHFGLKIHEGVHSSTDNAIDAQCTALYPNRVVGPVIQGDQRGRELGFPTANLELDDSNTVADGVWAGRCVLPNGAILLAAISVGRRPTFYGRSGVRLLEAHLLDFRGDLYGLTLTVELEHWMRGQTTFSSKEELAAALSADVLRTRSLLTEPCC